MAETNFLSLGNLLEIGSFDLDIGHIYLIVFLGSSTAKTIKLPFKTRKTVQHFENSKLEWTLKQLQISSHLSVNVLLINFHKHIITILT